MPSSFPKAPPLSKHSWQEPGISSYGQGFWTPANPISLSQGEGRLADASLQLCRGARTYKAPRLPHMQTKPLSPGRGVVLGWAPLSRFCGDQLSLVSPQHCREADSLCSCEAIASEQGGEPGESRLLREAHSSQHSHLASATILQHSHGWQDAEGRRGC